MTRIPITLGRWRARLLAVPAGAIPALAFPEPAIWVLGLVGLVPVLYLVCSAPSGREANWRAWFGGIGFFVAVHHWLIPVTGPFIVPLAMALATTWILWGWIAWRLLGDEITGPRVAFAMVLVPSAWVVTEFVRSWERLGGPWGLLGATQWANLRLLAVVSVGGVWLLSFLLAAVNVAVTVALLPVSPRPVRGLAFISAAALVTVGFAAPLAHPDADPEGIYRVAGVQTGVVHGGTARLDAHEELTRGLIGQSLDLVVWAESSVGVDLNPGSERVDRLAQLSRDVGAPILLNVDSRVDQGGIYKASVLLGPDGIEDRYDKMRLVPFGEYVPIRPLFGWVTRFTDAADEDRRRGEGIVVMDVDGVAIGPLVCFESTFADLTRHLADRGADVMVLQTATTTFQGTWAQSQHASLGAVRAVETGRPVVHAALSGVSALFEADGTLVTSLASSETGTWSGVVHLSSRTTFYARTGDWVPILSLLVLLISFGSIAIGARRARRVSRPGGVAGD